MRLLPEATRHPAMQYETQAKAGLTKKLFDRPKYRQRNIIFGWLIEHRRTAAPAHASTSWQRVFSAIVTQACSLRCLRHYCSYGTPSINITYFEPFAATIFSDRVAALDISLPQMCRRLRAFRARKYVHEYLFPELCSQSTKLLESKTKPQT